MTLDPVHSGIDLWHLMSIPGLLPALVPPMPALSVCTVSAAEMSDRVDHGEDPWDVIEEHTSWIWFSNRRGFTAAYWVARMIRSGQKLPSMLPVKEIVVSPRIAGSKQPFVIKASPHHRTNDVPPPQEWLEDCCLSQQARLAVWDVPEDVIHALDALMRTSFAQELTDEEYASRVRQVPSCSPEATRVALSTYRVLWA